MHKKRVYGVLMAMVIVFSGVGARLLQLSDDALKTASGLQSTRSQTFAVSRGTIYDRYLEPLVNAESQIVASIAPFEESVAAIREYLSAAETARITARFDEEERPIAVVSRFLPPTIGIAQAEVPVRYAAKTAAVHIVGYVDGENHGVTGVEKGYDDMLSACSGVARVTYGIDALGHPADTADELVENTLDRSVGGIALTLDSQMQALVYDAASAYLSRGAVIVTDAQTAQVLAAVSLPDYDPSQVAAVLEDAGSPLLDRTRINYNCGSVFKIITAAAALEKGVSPEKTYTCTGAVTVNGITFACHNHAGDGTITMRDAMALSCNSYFIQLARDIGASAVLQMARRAGWDSAYTIAKGVSAAAPVLPCEDTLTGDAALANFAIGQGDLLATPYHVHTVMQAVVNGGLRREITLYYGKVDEHGGLTPTGHEPEVTRLFSETTALELYEMLSAVVKKGTGAGAAPLAGVAAGKTGTAETGWLQNGSEVVQSWFTGAYGTDAPQYVITVLSENGGASGTPAAPLFASIADALYAAGLTA